MTRHSFRILALAGAALACAASPALAAQRSFPIGAFESVILAGSPDVQIRTGLKPSVVATGVDAALDRLQIRVENGTLIIDTKPGMSLGRNEAVDVIVTTGDLKSASITGSGDMDINKVAGAFKGSITGSGDMDIASIDAPTLDVRLTGSGDIKLAGKCGAGDFRVTGSGDVDADGLTCRTINASVTGSGDITARATETAALRVSGSGDIAITGGAKCTQSSSGSGTTSCR